MANVLNGQFINWSAMTGSQIRAKVAELQKLAKLQDKDPVAAAKKMEKVAARAVKPAPKKPDTVTKTAVKKAVKTAVKPAKKAAAKATGGRVSTTEKRIRAMSWIPQNGLLTADKADAVRKVMAEFDVPKNYAANWLKLAVA